MALNGIEEFVGEYLKIIEKCDFINYNTNFKINDDECNKQNGMAEVDIIGINTKEKKIFVCEVSAQINGIGTYADRVNKKFEKSRKYVETNLKEFGAKTEDIKYLFWCPFITDGEKRKITDQDVIIISKQEFLQAVDKLKDYLKDQTQVFFSPVTRFLQVYAHLEKKYRNK